MHTGEGGHKESHIADAQLDLRGVRRKVRRLFELMPEVQHAGLVPATEGWEWFPPITVIPWAGWQRALRKVLARKSVPRCRRRCVQVSSSAAWS